MAVVLAAVALAAFLQLFAPGPPRQHPIATLEAELIELPAPPLPAPPSPAPQPPAPAPEPPPAPAAVEPPPPPPVVEPTPEPERVVPKPVPPPPPPRRAVEPRPKPATPPRPASPPVAATPPAPSAPPAAAPSAPPVPAASPPAAAPSGGRMSARAIYQPLPQIPDALRRRDVDVVAVARFQVAADGSAAVELVQPTFDTALNHALLETLKTWRFFPALENGRPVASTVELRIPISVR